MEQLQGQEDAAGMIGVSTATLRYWRRNGLGPVSAKIGRRVVYRRSDIQRWIEQQFDQDTASR